jgi:hypothetical protein
VVVLSCWKVLSEQRGLIRSSRLRPVHFDGGPDNTEKCVHNLRKQQINTSFT